MTGQRWVWVTRPSFYLDDGRDRLDLDPARGYDPDGFWTCDPATRNGDLAVIYRSQIAKDIGYLVTARSDAEILEDQASEFDGWHVCRYQILARFEKPVTIADMRADDVLSTWPALRLGFVKRAFPVPDDIWDRLVLRLGVDAEALRSALVAGDRGFRLERQLQDWLRGTGSNAFAGVGWTMELAGHEVPCGRGRADLMYRQGSGLLRRQVVVELKRDKIGLFAVEQVLGYRDHLDRQVPLGRRRTMAILVGDMLDEAAEKAIRSDPRLTFVSIHDLQATR